MRKRNRRVEVHFTDQEHQHLKNQVTLSGHTTEQFVHNLVSGVELKPRSPDELSSILSRLSAIGNNINQIAKVANVWQYYVRREELDHIISMQNEIWRMVKKL